MVHCERFSLTSFADLMHLETSRFNDFCGRLFLGSFSSMSSLDVAEPFVVVKMPSWTSGLCQLVIQTFSADGTSVLI